MVGIKERMLDELSYPPTVWMEYKTDKKKLADDSYYIFFEGEDRKYFNPRIEANLSHNFNTYVCENRKNVISLWKKIRLKKTNRELFFVDKDYRFEPFQSNEEVFETNCYSIENYYTDTLSLKNILINEVGINKTSEDFDNIVSKYENLRIQFIEITKDFNAWAAACFHCEHLVNLSLIKFNNLLTVNIDGVKANADLSFSSIMQMYEEILKKRIETKKNHAEENYCDFISKKKAIINFYDTNHEFVYQNILNLYRGKNDLWFLQKFLQLIKEDNKVDKPKRILSKYYSCFNLDPNNSNILSSLSSYAITPTNLICYLNSYKV